MLKDQIFRRGVVLAGEDSSAEHELLLGFELVGGWNQVGSKTAREEVAGRTGGKQEEYKQRGEICSSSHSLVFR